MAFHGRHGAIRLGKIAPVGVSGFSPLAGDVAGDVAGDDPAVAVLVAVVAAVVAAASRRRPVPADRRCRRPVPAAPSPLRSHGSTAAVPLGLGLRPVPRTHHGRARAWAASLAEGPGGADRNSPPIEHSRLFLAGQEET